MLLRSSHPDKTAHRLVGLSKDGNEGQKESNTFVIQSPKTLLWDSSKPHCLRN